MIWKGSNRETINPSTTGQKKGIQWLASPIPLSLEFKINIFWSLDLEFGVQDFRIWSSSLEFSEEQYNSLVSK